MNFKKGCPDHLPLILNRLPKSHLVLILERLPKSHFIKILKGCPNHKKGCPVLFPQWEKPHQKSCSKKVRVTFVRTRHILELKTNYISKIVREYVDPIKNPPEKMRLLSWT